MKINECSCGCGGSSNNCMKEGGSEANYMFFGNLETIKRMIDDLMKMDPSKIDMILKNGNHNWAVDHIASSADDIQEVYNFLKNGDNQSQFKGDAFAEDHGFVKTFESYILSESKKKDQDEDGDKDFADAKVAQYIAGGMSKEEAIKKAKKFNK
jgi:hypothetical protein